MIDTVKDIARQAGVGAATMPRALNLSGYVKPETLAKIQQVAGELGCGDRSVTTEFLSPPSIG